MNIVAIHGQNHYGSTWNATQILVDELSSSGDVVQSFTLNLMPACRGCYNCFRRGEEHCPHFEQVGPIVSAIAAADVVILESPAYCLEMSGQMKSFVEHLGYRWYPHRPDPSMSKKIGVAIATTAGAGASDVTKSLKQQMVWWGIARIHRLSFRVAADKWADVSTKTRDSIVAQSKKTARCIRRELGNVKPTLKQRLIFSAMKAWHKNAADDYPYDKAYWKAKGWI